MASRELMENELKTSKIQYKAAIAELKKPLTVYVIGKFFFNL
jgi:hypothetical protein